MKTYPSRPRLSLDGDFRFTFDPGDRGIRAEWFERADIPAVRLSVPSAWGSVLRTHEPVGWYWKRFSVPPTLKDHILFLSFGAVDAVCEVWVNGRPVGKHVGGFVPFNFNINEAVHRTGSNLLAVRVVDVTAEHPTHPEVPPDLCRGGQGEYQEISGIWQSVYLEGRSALWIRDIPLRTEIDPPAFRGGCHLALPDLEGRQLSVEARLLTRKGDLLAHQIVPWENGDGDAVEFCVRPDRERVVPWSPEHPELYVLEVESHPEGEGRDLVRIRTGLRTVEASGSQLILNGKPLYIRGVLDPAISTGGVPTAVKASTIRDQIGRYRSQGFNLVRTHRKPFLSTALDACDEAGILVWEETPLADGTPWDAQDGNGERGNVALQEIEQLVRRDRHHPSLVIWGITSENMQSTTVQGGRWMHHLCHRIRELHPDSLVIENSDPFHYGAGTARSDILDFHAYRDLPTRADHSGDPRPTEPPNISSLNSEFGAWGFPAPEGLEQEGEYASLLSRLRRQFDELGLGDTFASLEDFCLDTQAHQYQTIKRQIEDLRANPKVTGYVLNGAHDCYRRCTGLSDVLQRPRQFASKMNLLNAGVVPIIDWPTRNFWSGDEVELAAVLANQSGLDIANWKLDYRAGRSDIILGRGSCKGESLPREEYTEAEGIRIRLPELETVTPFKLILGCQVDGKLFIETDWLFWGYPLIDAIPSVPVSVNVVGSWPGLWESLPHIEAASLDLCDVLLAREWDSTVEDALHGGGSVLLVAQSFERGKLGSRDDVEEPFKTSFVRQNHPIFTDFPQCRRVDIRFQALAPAHLMTGVRRPLVGYFRQWDHLGAAMAEFRVGEGRLLVTTLCFDHLGADPMTTHLLHAMIQYAAGEEFHPSEPLFL